MESIGIVIYERLGIFYTKLQFYRLIYHQIKKIKNLDQIEIKDLPIKYDSPLSV